MIEVPIGAKLTIGETGADNYWDVTVSGITAGEDGSYTMPADGATVTVTNTAKFGRIGYNLVLGGAWIDKPSTWVDNGTSAGGGQKYIDNARYYSDGDTYTATDRTPSATGHVFIAWLDKVYKDNPSTIVYPGNSGEYNRGNTNNGIQTLDAIWASISAADKTVTYDGQAHQIDAATAWAFLRSCL